LVLAQRNTSNSSPDDESMTVALLLCPEHNKQAGQPLKQINKQVSSCLVFFLFFLKGTAWFSLLILWNCLVFSSHIMAVFG